MRLSGVRVPRSDIRHQSSGAQNFDLFLRFDPDTQRSHDLEHGATRAHHLRQTLLLGLIFYNFFNFTSAILQPDILFLAVGLRLAIMTPASLVVAWLVLRRSPRQNELLAAATLLGLFAVPLFLFWQSQVPLSTYTFYEAILTLFYGGLVLSLRYRHLVLVCGVMTVFTGMALVTKAGMPSALVVALWLQFLTAVTFVLTGSYLAERTRCAAYVGSLIARQDAEAARARSQELAQLSYVDSLTGLANRRRFDLEAEAYLATDRSLGLLMIDVDYFKIYNDTHGHLQGDKCLSLVSGLIGKAATKSRGFAARFGGEEFAIILECGSEIELQQTCLMVLRYIRAASLPHPTRPDGPKIVTVSIGAVFVHANAARDTSVVLSAADKALYQAKGQGRNTFGLAEPALALPTPQGAKNENRPGNIPRRNRA